MDYLKITNWEKYQHYKDRHPPWIKLYHCLLDDYGYSCLQDDSKLLLMSLYMLASITNNQIPADEKWVQHKAMLSSKVDFTPLINNGFISINHDDSNMIANSYQDDSNMQAKCLSREEKRREDKEKRQIPDFISNDAWKEFKKYRTQIKAPLTEHAEKLLIADLVKLNEQGQDIEAVINQTIKSGKWKGFFPLKGSEQPYIEKKEPIQKGLCTKCKKQLAVFDGLCRECYGVSNMTPEIKQKMEQAFKSMPEPDEQKRIEKLKQQAEEMK